jgi:hypothetical protein
VKKWFRPLKVERWKAEKMGKVKGWKDGRLKGCWAMNDLGLTQMGH